MSALRGAARYRGDSEVSTWLYRITMNACLDRIRRRRTRSTEPLAGHDLPTPRDGIDDQLTRLTVADALATLPDGQRLAVVLVDVHGFSITEAARILGVREGTVKSRCARARGRLAGLLGHLRPRHPTTGAGRPGGRRERRGRRRRPTHEERDQGRPDRRRTVTDDQHAADDRAGEPCPTARPARPGGPRRGHRAGPHARRPRRVRRAHPADARRPARRHRRRPRGRARRARADTPGRSPSTPPPRVGGRSDAPSWSSSRPPPWSRRSSSGCSPRSRAGRCPGPERPADHPGPGPEVPVLAGGDGPSALRAGPGPLRLRTARRPGTTRRLPGGARGPRRRPTGRRPPGASWTAGRACCSCCPPGWPPGSGVLVVEPGCAAGAPLTLSDTLVGR